jgi:putative hydrolase of the HAD superfamily
MSFQQPAVIFDFGGVVFHWHPASFLARVLPERASTPEAAEYWKSQFFQNYEGDWGAFDSGLIEVPELVDRIAARTGLSEQEVLAVVHGVPAELAPQAGTVALMQALKDAGHRLFYLSNMPEPYAQHLERSHAFMSWFEAGVFSARVKTGKPKPEIFQIAFERFGLAPAEALFIDDHPANIEAAKALGLPALLFTSPVQLRADLVSLGLLA